MDFISLVVSFNLGLLSTPHCLAMCGGIITALSLHGGKTLATGRQAYTFPILYNGGRILSYIMAGAIAGTAGRHVVNAVMPAAGHNVLKIMAAVMLILIGLHLCQWLPGMRRMEVLGMKFWRLLQPLAVRSRQLKGMRGALLAGMVWGWLPCGLVYSVLLWSLASGGGWSGATLMLAFGLGTLPGMTTAGFLGQEIFALLQRRPFRIGGGLLLILLGVIFLQVDPVHQYHHH